MGAAWIETTLSNGQRRASRLGAGRFKVVWGDGASELMLWPQLAGPLVANPNS